MKEADVRLKVEMKMCWLIIGSLEISVPFRHSRMINSKMKHMPTNNGKPYCHTIPIYNFCCINSCVDILHDLVK